MEDVDDVLSYLKLDPDHHEKIAALIPKVCFPRLFQLRFVKGKHEVNVINSGRFPTIWVNIKFLW